MNTLAELANVLCTAKVDTPVERKDGAFHFRCSFLPTLAAAGAFSLLLLVAPSYAQTVTATDANASVISSIPAKMGPTAKDIAIRPFHISFPEEALADLRRRIAATKWPERETVSDATQGVQLATMQKLAHYWATEYDWRKWKRG